MSSLSGGLLPMKGVSSPTSTLDNMAPLAPLSSKSVVSKAANDGFDDNMFDDLLDAPAPTKLKKSKSKSKSKNKSSKKKSSKGSDFDYGDMPLSPNLGNSVDDFNFDAPASTFTAPSNIKEGDLDDSILGGFMGGSSKPRSIKTSAPSADTRPKSTSHAEETASYRNHSNVGVGAVVKNYDNAEEFEVRSSRPATTGSRRPRNYSPSTGQGNYDDDDLFNFNSSSRSQKPISSTTTGGHGSSNNGDNNNAMKYDFDDSVELPEQDGINTQPIADPYPSSPTTSITSEHRTAEVERPATTVGRRAHTSMFGNRDREGDKEGVGYSFGGRPRTTSGSGRGNIQGGQGRVSSDEVSTQPPAVATNPEDSLDMDFDIDALLPDSSNTNSSSGQRIAAPSPSLIPHLPSAPLSSKSRSPSPSKSHNTTTTIGNSSSGNVPSPSSSPLLGGGSKKQLVDDDDVDIGFMPSFLEAGREPRSRRQIGRSQSARGRLGGKAPFTLNSTAGSDDTEDSMDALDMALGIGGETPRAGGRLNKVKDPFALADKNAPPAQKPAASSSDKNTLPQLGSPRKAATSEQSSSHTSPSKDKDRETKAKDKDKDKERGDKHLNRSSSNSSSSKSNSGNTNNHNSHNPNLTVTVDVPSDKPLSNPPTVTLVTPAAGGGGGSRKIGQFSPDPAPYDHLNDSIGSTNSTTPTRPQGPTQQHNVTFSTKKLASSTSPVHNSSSGPGTGTGSGSGGGSAKKILKKSSSASDPQSPLSLSASFNKADNLHAGSTSSSISTTGHRPRDRDGTRRNSYDAATEGVDGVGTEGGSGGGGDEDFLSVSTSSLASPAPVGPRRPTWLSSPHNSQSRDKDSLLETSTGNATTGGGSDPSVRLLQRKLEEVMIQKDTIEKYLRAEIDVLKSKAAAGDGSGSGGGGVDQSVDAMGWRVKAAALAEENARLKEEAVVERLRHQQEMLHIRDKHAADMDAGNASRAEELNMCERRHRDAVVALKKLHLDELQAVKQRAKDGLALEQLSSQITSTTGSLKLIEEQMSLQYRGVDAVREGQFEARERLLQEMEAQAREKAEGAEIDTFKVKGLLSHMDQVVANLRNQGGEERERLRLEHRRLEAMQASLDSERRVMHERFNAEMDQVKRKLKAAEEDSQQDQALRREQYAEISESRRKLEGEQKEFAVYVTTSVQAAERSAKQLQEEEERLMALRAAVTQEQSSLQQQKYEAEEQLSQATGWRQSMQRTKQELLREREALEDLARELQDLSDILVQKDANFAKREEEMEARELHLTAEKAKIDEAYAVVQSKERELAQFHVHADQQRLAVRVLEEEVMERRVMVTQRQREVSRMQQDEANKRLQMALERLPSSGHAATNHQINHQNHSHNHSPVAIPAATKNNHNNYNNNNTILSCVSASGANSQGGFSRPQEKEKENMKQVGRRGESGVRGGGSGVSPIQRGSGGARASFDFEKEIASAQHTMQRVRGGVAKISHTNNQRDTFLRDENEFLSKIQHSRRI